MVTSYFVKNGNTLGYTQSDHPTLFGVLAGKPQHGGDNWMNGPVTITEQDKLEPATIADFDRFRHKGHIA
jgi:hypothetical protein